MERLYPSIGKPNPTAVPAAEDNNANRLFALPDMRGVTGVATAYTGSAFFPAKASTLLNNGLTGAVVLPTTTVTSGLTGFIGGAGYVNMEYVDADGVKQTGAIPFFKHSV